MTEHKMATEETEREEEEGEEEEEEEEDTKANRGTQRQRHTEAHISHGHTDTHAEPHISNGTCGMMDARGTVLERPRPDGDDSWTI